MLGTGLWHAIEIGEKERPLNVCIVLQLEDVTERDASMNNYPINVRRYINS